MSWREMSYVKYNKNFKNELSVLTYESHMGYADEEITYDDYSEDSFA